MSDYYLLPIWPGSSSFFPGDTPYGYYDSDPQFQIDIEATAEWCARRLGYGLSNVELQDKHFFAAFEEAVTEYGQIVNTFSVVDNMLNPVGQTTGSGINLSQTYIQPEMKQIFELSKEYGNPIGAGGNKTWYTGSFDTVENQQVYDLKTVSVVESGSFATDKFTLRKLFYLRAPASLRFYGEAYGGMFPGAQFGWTYGTTYVMLPLNYDVYNIQAVEFNDEVRRADYSFQLTNNRLRIFPIPRDTFKVHFHYTLDNENSSLNSNITNKDKISDFSNVPFSNITYSKINAIGKQWIRKYTLAICKEILGYIRGKYATIPIADGETTLNAQDLLTAGKEEKDALVTDLKETLDKLTRQAQLERKVTEAQSLNDQLQWFPLKIYTK